MSPYDHLLTAVHMVLIVNYKVDKLIVQVQHMRLEPNYYLMMES